MDRNKLYSMMDYIYMHFTTTVGLLKAQFWTTVWCNIKTNAFIYAFNFRTVNIITTKENVRTYRIAVKLQS